MDKRKFTELTENLFSVFYIKPEINLLKIWYEEIKEFDIKIYEEVIKKYIRSNNKKPYLSDVLTLLKENSPDDPNKNKFNFEYEYRYV